MASAIDETKPILLEPTTESVRDNFRIAKAEISGLQALTAGAPFLPLTGGLISGTLNVAVGSDLIQAFACAGATKGVRIVHDAAGSHIQGVDSTWSGSYQPITLEGTSISLIQGATGVVGLRMNPDASITIGGRGIDYSDFGYANHIAWGWTGTALHAFVDGTDQGAVQFAASSALVNAVKELTARLETVEALLVTGSPH